VRLELREGVLDRIEVGAVWREIQELGSDRLDRGAHACAFVAAEIVRQRTQLINALRGHMTEFGIVVAQGPMHVAKLVAMVDDPTSTLPKPARIVLEVLIAELRALDERVAKLDAEIVRRAKDDPTARRLMTIPGIGAITATALVALAPSAAIFRRGRDFAA
jgi:transposase